MDREKICEMLGEYLSYRARMKFLECRMMELTQILERAKESAVEDAVHITPGYESGGGGGGNRISNPVEKLAIAFASGEVPESVKDIEDAIKECGAEISELQPVVTSVAVWLEALTDREELVIRYKEIQKCSWNELSRIYEDRFPGEIFSRRALRNKRDQAIDKIRSITR